MNFLNLMLCLLCSFASYAQNSKEIESINQEGQLACELTILAYPELRDNGPTKEYGELFTQESTFEVKELNILLKGREEISARLESALRATKTVHIITSVKVDFVSNNIYKSHADFKLHLQKLPEDKFKSVNIKGYYDDLLEYDGKRCRIVSRQVIIKSQQP